MKVFRDTKRRATQQVLQTLGVAKGVDDSEFSIECECYRRTVQELKGIQSALRIHLETLQKQHAASVALSNELTKFYVDTPFGEGIRQFHAIHCEVERVQLASVERLYREMIISAADEILWQVPEIEDQIKQRKGLLLDYNAHLRKFESLKSSLAAASNDQNRFGHEKGGGLFGRRKSGDDLQEEALSRKLKLDQAELAVNTVTDWLRKKFNEIETQRAAGEILRNPMSALTACEYHLANETVNRLNQIKTHFPLAGDHKATLTQYDVDFARIAAETAAVTVTIGRAGSFTQMAGISLAEGSEPNKKNLKVSLMDDDNGHVGCFGQSLRSLSSGENALPPSVVYDCIDYLESHGGISTEGIFRIPGSQEMVVELKRLYETEQSVNLDKISGVDCQDVAGLLKLFFRDLPEPLVPCSQYHAILGATAAPIEVPDVSSSALGLDDSANTMSQADVKKEREKRVCDVARNIPIEHLQCLGLLLHFLNKVSKNADRNKMNAFNLATCFAPSLFRAPDNTPTQKVLQDMHTAIAALVILIENADQFPFPRRKSNKQMLPPVTPTSSAIKNDFVSSRPLSETYEGIDTFNMSPIGDGLGL